MSTCTDNSPNKKEPFVSSYDPSIFYSPIYNKTATKPGMPVHHLVDYKIKLTVTLKDIGLEGLDSPNVKKPSKNRKRANQKKQENVQSNQRENQRVITFPDGIIPTPGGDNPLNE